jgi:hypothetical protein
MTSPRAQLVVTADTKEGRYVSRIYDRPEAEQLMTVIENAMRIDGDNGVTATISFITFALDGGRVTLRGRLINSVELLPIGLKDTSTYQPGPDPTLGTHSPMFT